jgi:hypothetical protein
MTNVTNEPIKIKETDKTKPKRLSKSSRLHVRRMKQAARKEGTVYRPVI